MQEDFSKFKEDALLIGKNVTEIENANSGLENLINSQNEKIQEAQSNLVLDENSLAELNNVLVQLQTDMSKLEGQREDLESRVILQNTHQVYEEDVLIPFTDSHRERAERERKHELEMNEKVNECFDFDSEELRKILDNQKKGGKFHRDQLIAALQEELKEKKAYEVVTAKEAQAVEKAMKEQLKKKKKEKASPSKKTKDEAKYFDNNNMIMAELKSLAQAGMEENEKIAELKTDCACKKADIVLMKDDMYRLQLKIRELEILQEKPTETVFEVVRDHLDTTSDEYANR